MARRLTLAVVAALVLAALVVPPALAQRHGFGGPAHGFSGGARGGFYGPRHSEFPRGYFLGDFPFFYEDYPFAPAVPDSGPQLILQSAAADTPSQPKPAPLLIELQGDRYVRYGGAGRSSEEAQSSERDAARSAAENRNHSSTDPAQLAPTILIYRDGHREQIPDYAIVGRVLYAHNECGADTPVRASANCNAAAQPGYGLRNIQLSALDLTATMKANRENGVNFVLPTGPNEVVTRP